MSSKAPVSNAVEELIKEAERIKSAHCDPDNPNGWLSEEKHIGVMRHLRSLSEKAVDDLRNRNLPRHEAGVWVGEVLGEVKRLVDLMDILVANGPKHRHHDGNLEDLRREFQACDLPRACESLWKAKTQDSAPESLLESGSWTPPQEPKPGLSAGQNKGATPSGGNSGKPKAVTAAGHGIGASGETYTDRQDYILEAMLDLGAKDESSSKTTLQIAKQAEAKALESSSFKQAVSELGRRRLVDTKQGRGGGCWLTDAGLKRAKLLCANS